MKNLSPKPIEIDPNRTIQPLGFPGLPENWVSQWLTFDGAPPPVKLFGVLHHLSPWKKPRALVILHGMGEHSGRYQHFPHYLSGAVDAVLAFDHRGHGRSEGLRGFIDRFDLFADDAALVIQNLHQRMKDQFGTSEIHLLGHSLGGHIALRTLFLHPELQIASATISAPFLAVKAKVPVAKKIASAALARIWGSVQLAMDLDATAISRDPAVVEAYRKDRLVHDKITPQLFEDMQKVMKDTLKRKTGIKVPLQFLIPGQDQLVDAEVSHKFAESFDSADKRIKSYPDFFHEPFNELGKEEAFADVDSWIRAHRTLEKKGRD